MTDSMEIKKAIKKATGLTVAVDTGRGTIAGYVTVYLGVDESQITPTRYWVGEPVTQWQHEINDKVRKAERIFEEFAHLAIGKYNRLEAHRKSLADPYRDYCQLAKVNVRIGPKWNNKLRNDLAEVLKASDKLEPVVEQLLDVEKGKHFVNACLS